MELAQIIGAPPGSVSGDDLEKLAGKRKELKGYLDMLNGTQTLYITTKDGFPHFGALSKHESEAPRKRLVETIEKKISEVEKEIRKKISG
ncbi:hypothetical protein KA005_04990 [bacterium]|nr:hypothetical protein [bacterium]